MEKRASILARVPAVIESLAGRSYVVAAYLFGSSLDETREVVRDVDVAVLGRAPLSLSQVGDLVLELERGFETDRIDVVDLRCTARALRHAILARGRRLVEADADEAARFREWALRDFLAHCHREREYARELHRALVRRFARAGR